MSVWVQTDVECHACGHVFQERTVDGLNLTRNPDIRAAVMEGKLNVFTCPACRATVMVERTFLYTDLERGHFILVRPMSALPWYARIERDIEDLYHFYVENEPTGRLFTAEQLAAFKVRAVVGYPWLQEKLRLFDAGLDDRVVEAMKVAILRDRPELKGYVQLLVDDIGQDELRFIATREKGRRPLRFGQEPRPRPPGPSSRLEPWHLAACPLDNDLSLVHFQAEAVTEGGRWSSIG